MDKTDLQIFFEIAKHGTIQKASQALYMSSSTVGQRLNTLEDELGYRLFDRQKGLRSSPLTIKGQEFYCIATKLMNNFEEAEKLKDFDDEPSLTIASVDSIISGLLFPFFQQIMFCKEKFRLSLQTCNAYNVDSLIENRLANIGFSIYNFNNSRISIQPLFSDDMVIVVPNNFHIKKKCIHTNLLDPSRELQVNRPDGKYTGWGHEFNAWHDKYFDYRISPLLVCSSIVWLSDFFTNDNIWAILPRNVALYIKQKYNIRIIEIKNTAPRRICYQLTNINQPAMITEYIDLFNTRLDEYIHHCANLGTIYPYPSVM